jgi:hypothetical protein
MKMDGRKSPCVLGRFLGFSSECGICQAIWHEQQTDGIINIPAAFLMCVLSTRTGQTQRLRHRLLPRRDLLAGLVKFLAVGCGLNEFSPLANH